MNALRRLPPRDRRALTLGAAALVPVLLFRGVVQPYVRARAALADRLAAQRGLLERELTVLAGAQRLPERRAHVDRLLAADAPRLLPGGDPLAASAELVGYVGDAARRSHVLVSELQSRGSGAAPGGDGLTRLQVEVRGQTDFEGVLRFLQALERGPRLVRVDAVSIEGGGVAPDARRETLTLRAAVSGYAAGRLGL